MRNRLAITVGVLGLSSAAWWGLWDHVVATEPIVVRAASLQAVHQREAPGNPQVLVKLKFVKADRTVVNAVWKKLAQGKADSASAIVVTGIYSTQESDTIVTELRKHDSTKILGEPSIMVVSGRTASFIAGGEVGVPTIVGVGPSTGVTAAFHSEALETIVTPTAMEDGAVRLKLSCEQNRLDETTRAFGIPGLKSCRVNPLTMLLKPGQSVIVFLPEFDATTTKSSTDATDAVDSRNEPKRATFVVVTPEVVKPMAPADVTTTHPKDLIAVPTPYAPVVDFESPTANRLSPFAPPAAWPPSFPFDGRFMPNPGAFGSLYLPIELTRLQHLQSAKSHLEQAGLTDLDEAILKEITVEQRSLAKRELQRKERELEQLQKELESLRRSLSEETDSRSE